MNEEWEQLEMRLGADTLTLVLQEAMADAMYLATKEVDYSSWEATVRARADSHSSQTGTPRPPQGDADLMDIDEYAQRTPPQTRKPPPARSRLAPIVARARYGNLHSHRPLCLQEMSAINNVTVLGKHTASEDAIFSGRRTSRRLQRDHHERTAP